MRERAEQEKPLWYTQAHPPSFPAPLSVHLTLLVPELIWPEPADQHTLGNLAAPGLEWMLARARSGELGVWLAAGEDVAALADDLALLQVIGLHFPKFTDGRSYSAATLLRTRHGYRGELRAIGQVLRDQFNYMTRCGFDALQPQAERYTDEQLESAIASIDDFTQPYQRSVQDPLPLFRRVERGNGSGVQR